MMPQITSVAMPPAEGCPKGCRAACPLGIALPARKSFQYTAHRRPNHDYSPFHTSLEAALKHFYGKVNLQTVLLKKELLRYENLHLLDHATVDVWPNVVMVKIPKWVPYQGSQIFQRAAQSFCRFISKKDFLAAIIDYAMLQGHQSTAYQHRNDAAKMVVSSITNSNVYELTPTEHQCECDCPAHQSLYAGFAEDVKMLSLLLAHPILRGQLPDKHVFSLWATWGVNNFASYRTKQQDWKHQQQTLWRHKEILKSYSASLVQDIPGHFNVMTRSGKIGTVDQRFDLAQNSWWVNQRQISRHGRIPGDHIHYGTPQEAAIALVNLCQVIEKGERAKADLFGGGYDEPAQHLVELPQDFIDDVNQEAPQLVTVASQKKAQRDPFGGFDF